MEQKNIFAISGSLRLGSSQHIILNKIGDILPSNITYTVYNQLEQIPAFSPSIDTENQPVAVVELRKQLAIADAIIICTPEYAFGVPGALKNAIDWMVSSASFTGKPTALITASTSGQYAHESLVRILGAVDAHLLPEATLLLPYIRTRINNEGKIIDTDTINNLSTVAQALIKSVSKP